MTFARCKKLSSLIDPDRVKAAFERQPFGSDTCAIHSCLAWQTIFAGDWHLVSCDQSNDALVIGVSLFFCCAGLNNLLQPKKSSEEAAAKLQMALEAAAKESNQMYINIHTSNENA